MGILRHIRRLRGQDDGAILVEFGMVLPIMLVLFGLSIEAGRTFWSYQATIAGVRDATRYIGRVVDTDICEGGGASIAGWEGTVTDIVRNASDGTALFPSSITVTRVTPVLDCITEGDFRQDAVPMARITAELEITFPFSALFRWAGSDLPTIDTVVSDTGRIFGT